jgi:hypothetical protein
MLLSCDHSWNCRFGEPTNISRLFGLMPKLPDLTEELSGWFLSFRLAQLEPSQIGGDLAYLPDQDCLSSEELGFKFGH